MLQMAPHHGRGAVPEGSGGPGQSRFAEHAGLRVLLVEEDRATVVLPVSETVLSEAGGIDRGAIGTLVEAAGTAAALGERPGGERTDTMELFVSFVRAAPAHPLTAEAHVVRGEGDVRVCEVDVRDWDGELVARGFVTHRR